jgi:hypothetical protein
MPHFVIETNDGLPVIGEMSQANSSRAASPITA